MGSLSSVTSILSPLLTATGLPGALVGAGSQIVAQKQARAELRAEQGLALSQLQSRQKQNEDQATADAALEKQKIDATAAADEARRQQALRRAVARQKTLFSAQGLGGSAQGSNEAVLLGLVNDSLAQSDQAQQLDTLRRTALDQSVEQTRQKNLLEYAQLAQRQNLSRYYA